MLRCSQELKKNEKCKMTQKYTQKYTIVQLFDDIEEGYEFTSDNWPLHATIADTFAIDWNIQTFIEKLKQLLKSHTPATSVVEGDRFFGDHGQVQVALLRKTNDLINLHHDVINLLEQGGWIPNDPQFAKEGFLPHSTVQKHGRLEKNDKVIFNGLTIIDMFPDGNPFKRKVIKTISLQVD